MLLPVLNKQYVAEKFKICDSLASYTILYPSILDEQIFIIITISSK